MRFYRLDATDTIDGIDPGWDSFAEANGGKGAMAERVVGQSLWDFIAGQETITALDRLFHNARQSATPWGLRYRCDSPRQERLFQLTALPLQGRALLVRHALIRSRPRIRDVVKDLSQAKRLWHCSQCLSYSASEHSFDAGHVINPEDRHQIIDHICKDCRATFQPAWTAITCRSIA